MEPGIEGFLKQKKGVRVTRSQTSDSSSLLKRLNSALVPDPSVLPCNVSLHKHRGCPGISSGKSLENSYLWVSGTHIVSASLCIFLLISRS